MYVPCSTKRFDSVVAAACLQRHFAKPYLLSSDDCGNCETTPPFAVVRRQHRANERVCIRSVYKNTRGRRRRRRRCAHSIALSACAHTVTGKTVTRRISAVRVCDSHSPKYIMRAHTSYSTYVGYWCRRSVCVRVCLCTWCIDFSSKPFWVWREAIQRQHSL